MEKQSTTLIAAAGLALALGAPLVASIPANAAVQPSPTTSSSAVTTGIGAHVFSGGKLEITSSTIHDGVITVTGKSAFPDKDIEIAAGAGWVAVGKTDETGRFDVSLDVANSGGYEIRFGKRVTPTLFGKAYQALWYGTPVS
ncbi:hypothetical protein E9228_001699 [Curtobacterium flaccumfaciens]|uniref:Uncharacterized protein n=1 Tax=Curtobacterium salicis TaxID=1779862 RepID=A0ABX0T804_9MICO|nr:hypothetical protein [Curtobacterium sp. WW7]NII41063.1 hypothetical protein [Curtobacterium sp. WW7]